MSPPWLSAVVLATALLPACGGSGTSTPIGVEQSTQARITSPAVPAGDAMELVSGNQAFAVDLYQALHAQNGTDANLVFSPASLSIALAMLYNGAANETATQMAATLHFTLPVDRLNAAFDALDLALTAPPTGGGAETFQLSLVNSTWIQRDFSILPAYLDVLGESYGAGVNTVDFVAAPDNARNAINAWVAGQTQNEIPTLLPTGSIDDLTRLVLANAVYFHGDWVTPFMPNSPTGIFHAPAGDVTVPMMIGEDNATLWSGNGWSAAALPYDGNTTSMIVVVPDAGTFDSFEAALTAEGLAAAINPGQQSEGALTMPRFKFSLAESLNKTLSAMGMSDAFTDAADLSGIDGATDLKVQAVVHQADIAVDEQGTTAAAATGVVVGRKVSVEVGSSLTVDRPFLFFIVHQPTGALLFAGRVVDPTANN
jgi:serpin B